MEGKNLFYCISNTILEWYDFGVFGALSTVISKILFPHKSQVTGLLLVFAIFATAFFIRPIGGIIISHIGDKHGRKTAIVISVLSMAIASLSNIIDSLN